MIKLIYTILLSVLVLSKLSAQNDTLFKSDNAPEYFLKLTYPQIITKYNWNDTSSKIIMYFHAQSLGSKIEIILSGAFLVLSPVPLFSFNSGHSLDDNFTNLKVITLSLLLSVSGTIGLTSSLLSGRIHNEKILTKNYEIIN